MNLEQYDTRFYRDLHQPENLVTFRVVVQETDLLIHSENSLAETARELVLKQRGYIESYIRAHPTFLTSMSPWTVNDPAPPIVRDMIAAGMRAGVGPMAAVAGAVAEHVGRELLEQTRQVIVENGGDVFIHSDAATTIAIYAGDSPLSLRVGVRAGGRFESVAVCTSSGNFGHSLSQGRADAVCAVAPSGALADATATSIGNHVRSGSDITGAIEIGKKIPGVKGLIIICADRCGIWGDIEVIPLQI